MIALTALQGTTEKLILGFKDHGLVSLARELSIPISQHLAQLRLPNSTVIVLPAKNEENYRKRGYDPALKLIRRAAQPLGLRIIRLRRVRAVGDQRRLNSSERESNLSQAFKAPPLDSRSVFLFDDVTTTGATMREMARAVIESGGVIVGGCALAQRNLVLGHPDSN